MLEQLAGAMRKPTPHTIACVFLGRLQVGWKLIFRTPMRAVRRNSVLMIYERTGQECERDMKSWLASRVSLQPGISAPSRVGRMWPFLQTGGV
jgi:hypothetical protein